VTQRRFLDPVHGDLLAVDLDDRDPLPVVLLELGNPGDLDLVDVEAELLGKRGELLASPVAQVAVAGRVEGDGLQG
jgi:hypothetical protein